MLKRGELVVLPNGVPGLILAIFDGVVYQPTLAELLVGGNIMVVPCNKLTRLNDSPTFKTLEELISSHI